MWKFKICDLLLIVFLILIKVPNFVTAARNSSICGQTDVRNNIEELNRLKGCTVVYGFLQIVLIENATSKDFDSYSFPELREITGYLLVHRVRGLKSIGSLFPNLVVIRGQSLIANNALIIYELNNLQLIGLKSLIAVQNGQVWITKCPILCYADTIDWNLIAPPGRNNIEKSNVICPSSMSCRECDPKNCWSSKHCQKVDDGYNFQGKKCHEECLGGCTNKTATGCTTCRHYVDKGVCVEKCPKGKIIFPDNLRCITEKVCHEFYRRIIFEGQCIEHCPPGYIVYTVDDDKAHDHLTCTLCSSDCEKPCIASEITSLEEASNLKTCTVIKGPLNIRLEIFEPNTMEKLEEYLGNIDEILGYLKIYRSIGITSLKFLKSLNSIRGEELEQDLYSIVIYANDNLNELWNWHTKTDVQVSNGSLFLAQNSKLCLPHVNEFRDKINIDRKHDFVCPISNGSERKCKHTVFPSYSSDITTNTANIIWEEYKNKNNDIFLISYVINIANADHTSTVPHYGINYCMEESWNSVFVHQFHSGKESSNITYKLKQLAPYTKYYFYIEAFLHTNNTELNVTNGQSLIENFRTLPVNPTPQIIHVIATTSTSITISWIISPEEHDLVKMFIAEIFTLPDKLTILDTRDYCLNPRNENLREWDNGADCCWLKYIFSFEKEVCPDGSCYKKEYERTKRNLDEDDFHNHILELAGLNFVEPAPVKREIKGMDKPNYVATYQFEKTVKNFTIKNLKPFTLYSLEVSACHTEDMCGTYFLLAQRTAKYKSKPLKVTVNATDAIELKFMEPKETNSITVAYHIEYKRLNQVNETVYFLCITRVDHVYNKHVFALKAPTGDYSFRVRSVSLAGNETYTNWIDVSYKNPNDSDGTGLIVFFFIFGVFALAMVGYWYYVKRRNFYRSDNEDSLLGQEFLPNRDQAVDYRSLILRQELIDQNGHED